MALPSEAATKELFAAYWRTRSIEDRNAIVAAWEPLIRIVMQKHKRQWDSSDDPYSYAAEGLISAVESYDGQINFGTWATSKIRWRLIDGAREMFGRGDGRAARIKLRALSQIRDKEIRRYVSEVSDARPAPEHSESELHLLLQRLAGKQAGRFIWLWIIKGELLKTIGQRHGLSESRVSQICTQGLENIREQRQRVAAALGLETVELRPA